MAKKPPANLGKSKNQVTDRRAKNTTTRLNRQMAKAARNPRGGGSGTGAAANLGGKK